MPSVVITRLVLVENGRGVTEKLLETIPKKT